MIAVPMTRKQLAEYARWWRGGDQHYYVATPAIEAQYPGQLVAGAPCRHPGCGQPPGAPVHLPPPGRAAEL